MQQSWFYFDAITLIFHLLYQNYFQTLDAKYLERLSLRKASLLAEE